MTSVYHTPLPPRAAVLLSSDSSSFFPRALSGGGPSQPRQTASRLEPKRPGSAAPAPRPRGQVCEGSRPGAPWGTRPFLHVNSRGEAVTGPGVPTHGL